MIAPTAAEQQAFIYKEAWAREVERRKAMEKDIKELFVWFIVDACDLAMEDEARRMFEKFHSKHFNK